MPFQIMISVVVGGIDIIEDIAIESDYTVNTRKSAGVHGLLLRTEHYS